MKKTIPIIFLFMLIIFIGCKKKDNTNANTTTNPTPVAVGANEITYSNGCGYANNTFTISPLSAISSPNTNMTGVSQNSPWIASISMRYPSSIGTHFLSNPGTGIYMTLHVSDTNSTCSYLTSSADYYSDSIVLNMTKYDSPGGLIEGTWGGRLIDDDILNDTIRILNASGKFSLIRGADQ